MNPMSLISSRVIDPAPSTSYAAFNVNLENLIRYRVTAPSHKARKGRTKQHSKILSSTPIEDDLIDKDNRKQQKDKTKKTARRANLRKSS